MLFILLLVLFSTRAILNKPTNNNYVKERIRSRQENVTHMVNVTATLSELCLSFSDGFRCNREVTHFIPKVSLETREYKDLVTSCCPGYVSDGGDGCVAADHEDDDEGSAFNSVVDLDFLEDLNITDFQTQTGIEKTEDEPQLILDEGLASDMEAKNLKEDVNDENLHLGPPLKTDDDCNQWMWGQNCDRTCLCDHDGSRGCDDETGQCLCHLMWTGDACEMFNNQDGRAISICIYIIIFIILVLTLVLIFHIQCKLKVKILELERQKRRKAITTKVNDVDEQSERRKKEDKNTQSIVKINQDAVENPLYSMELGKTNRDVLCLELSPRSPYIQTSPDQRCKFLEQRCQSLIEPSYVNIPMTMASISSQSRPMSLPVTVEDKQGCPLPETVTKKLLYPDLRMTEEMEYDHLDYNRSINDFCDTYNTDTRV